MENQYKGFVSEIKNIIKTRNIREIDSVGFDISNNYFEYKIYEFENYKSLNKECLGYETIQLLDYIEKILRISLCSVAKTNSNKKRINLIFSNRNYHDIKGFFNILKKQCSIYGFEEIIKLNNYLFEQNKESSLYIFGYNINEKTILNYKLYFMTRIEAHDISDPYLYKYNNDVVLNYLYNFTFLKRLNIIDSIKLLIDFNFADIHILALDFTKEKIIKVKVYLKFKNSDIDAVISTMKFENYLDIKSLLLLNNVITQLKEIEDLITNLLAICIDENGNISFNFYSDFIKKYKDVEYL